RHEPAEKLEPHRWMECEINNRDKKKRGYKSFAVCVECSAFPKRRDKNGHAYQAKREQNQVATDFKAHRLPGSDLNPNRPQRWLGDSDADYTQRDDAQLNPAQQFSISKLI